MTLEEQLRQLNLKHQELFSEIQKLSKKINKQPQPNHKGMSVLGWKPESGEPHYIIDTLSKAYRWFDFDRRLLGHFKNKEDAELRLRLVKALCPSEVWIPEELDKYYFYDETDNIDSEDWYHTNTDYTRLSQGNVFKTKEEAKEYGKVLQEWADRLTK